MLTTLPFELCVARSTRHTPIWMGAGGWAFGPWAWEASVYDDERAERATSDDAVLNSAVAYSIPTQETAGMKEAETKATLPRGRLFFGRGAAVGLNLSLLRRFARWSKSS